MMAVDPIVQVIHSWEATIVAVSFLLSAPIVLLTKFKKFIIEFKLIIEFICSIIKPKGGSTMIIKIKNFKITITCFLLLIVPITLFVARATEPIPPNVKMMNDVWWTYNNAKDSNKDAVYSEAIKKARELIQEFEPGAQLTQKKLLEENIEKKGPGVYSKEEKKIIWIFGPLHEVSACWWVIGRSMEKQGKKVNAIEAYEKAAAYPHALVYDKSWDGFWSPIEDSLARIENLKKE
jgi:hypothetical protein